MKNIQSFDEFLNESKIYNFLKTLSGNNIDFDYVPGADPSVSKESILTAKKLGVDIKKTGIVYDYSVKDWNEVLDLAKAANLKFEEGEDEIGRFIVFY